MSIRKSTPLDGPRILEIYEAGIQTGIATFETKAPSWEEWDQKFLAACRLVMVEEQVVIGWAALSAVSKRAVYRGVAEVTIYVDPNFQGRGVGKALLQELIVQSEAAGFWTLQASIFKENAASIRLHLGAGFREVGYRERVAQRDGVWKDNLLLERRSALI